MQAVADAIMPAIEGALAPEIPAVRVYVDERDSRAPLPHAWVYSGSTTKGQKAREGFQTLSYVHVWARSKAEIREFEARLMFLDGHGAPKQGGAVFMRYALESATETREESAWHLTLIVSAKYWHFR